MKNREQRQQQQTIAYVEWFKTFGVGVRGIENFSDLKQAFEAGYNAGYRLGMIDGKDVENIHIGKFSEENKLFIVRLYDMFDGWMDVSASVCKAEALRIWNEKTSNGTKMTKYEDGDYYSIFPADTVMLMTPETLGR